MEVISWHLSAVAKESYASRFQDIRYPERLSKRPSPEYESKAIPILEQCLCLPITFSLLCSKYLLLLIGQERKEGKAQCDSKCRQGDRPLCPDFLGLSITCDEAWGMSRHSDIN
jgi:hypothetical protein